MPSKYISAEEFKDFSHNQKEMIKTLNHSMTKLTTTVIKIDKRFEGFMGEFKIIKRLVWWILGIISLIVIAAILSNIF